ncbi:MAG: flagellar export protein FliJ [Rhodanobacter sp.]|nr:MAG: flagellar export protein FliJ [Rhodanobacter sp.]TAM04714.1 MAG: flagellar export protein FliJ [Rhodanobacter sp.]TAM42049.1 MAG: flagellar export protein FliJ [Rhodanobacter sp.]TAN25770.1 MAG: flagellar export protein FliJ [Rhodanobacter sp.]
MTSRASRLQPAVEQARQRSEEALTHFASQQQVLAKAEHQLSELRRYREEYAHHGDAMLSVSAMLNRHSFIQRIDQAIGQQRAEIARHQRQLEQVREQWRRNHARASALDSVVAQHLERERRAEERHEQAEIDERFQYRRSS